VKNSILLWIIVISLFIFHLTACATDMNQQS